MTGLRSLMLGGPDSRTAGLSERAQSLLGAIGAVDPGDRELEATDACSTIDAILDGARPDLCWLALSVLSARVADVCSVERACREIRCGMTPGEVIAGSLESSGALDVETWVPVSVRRGGVLVDVEQTSRDPLGTGIQRVVRETARRWSRRPDTTLVGWTNGYEGLRELGSSQVSLATGVVDVERTSPGPREAQRLRELQGPAAADARQRVIIPWRSTLLIPELAVERSRPEALGGIARFARCSTGIIGHDCVPLTMAETALSHVPVAYMRYLAACAHTTRVAATCDTSALEFRSWRSTLASRGISGPDIETVELATEVTPSASRAEPAGQAGGRSGRPAFFFDGSDIPMVVVVGSHEPRKNHMTVLHAAELLWRRGERFSLLFLGGNSWHSEPFFERLGELRSKGRMVDSLSAAPDDVVSSAYRAAACSVFVSLHEGFGLPVVESLAHATPVITSCYGTMAHNARRGGCLLVDPRDPHQVADAISRVINHDDLRRKLSSEAAAVPARSWDTYAREAWDFLVHGRPPR